ncbi:MAG: transposase [Bacteroidetes bacterium]|nr:transposase [Bacteroidota bacterium]
MTVVDWIDVFTRKNNKMEIIESLKYCQKQKVLKIFAWCLMPSHLHLIIRAEDDNKLSDILRDLKKIYINYVLILEEFKNCLPNRHRQNHHHQIVYPMVFQHFARQNFEQ